MRIDSFAAPAMLTWQLTRDCDLACLHCCTESAPGKALPAELSRDEAIRLCGQIIEAQVPYVMIVGGEPTIVAHFTAVAETLGKAGVWLKIETNGQTFGDAHAERLSRLPIRSIQISIDGATEETYRKMRPGGSLQKALAACRSVRKFGMPLEVTFAPSRLNIHEAASVMALAVESGAFRFNTGRLMRLGTAARVWDRLDLVEADWKNFYSLLEAKEKELAGRLELCFRPFSLVEELRSRSFEPSGTLLVLPDGKVKVSAPLAYLCADLRTQTLREAWAAYRRAWGHPRVREGLRALSRDPRTAERANRWVMLDDDLPVVV